MNNDGKMDAKEMPIFKRCMTRKEQGTPGYDADHDGQVSDKTSTRTPTSRSTRRRAKRTTMRRRGVDTDGDVGRSCCLAFSAPTPTSSCSTCLHGRFIRRQRSWQQRRTRRHPRARHPRQRADQLDERLSTRESSAATLDEDASNKTTSVGDIQLTHTSAAALKSGRESQADKSDGDELANQILRHRRGRRCQQTLHLYKYNVLVPFLVFFSVCLVCRLACIRHSHFRVRHYLSDGYPLDIVGQRL